MAEEIDDSKVISENGDISIDSNENTLDMSEDPTKVKKKKPGIIYLPNIPKCMTATYIRELLSAFGEIGRVYLQEDPRDVAKAGKKKRKKSYARIYDEGWVEFKSKRVAKEVARVLNNTQIGGRKKSKYYDYIWTIKYLPRFKWTHLSERLTYEQAVHKQRMRAEIYQAKKEADYFSANVEKSEKLKKNLSKGRKLVKFEINPEAEIRQRETEDQIIEKKKLNRDSTLSKSKSEVSGNADDRDDFLKSLFN